MLPIKVRDLIEIGKLGGSRSGLTGSQTHGLHLRIAHEYHALGAAVAAPVCRQRLEARTRMLAAASLLSGGVREEGFYLCPFGSGAEGVVERVIGAFERVGPKQQDQ